MQHMGGECQVPCKIYMSVPWQGHPGKILKFTILEIPFQAFCEVRGRHDFQTCILWMSLDCTI